MHTIPKPNPDKFPTGHLAGPLKLTQPCHENGDLTPFTKVFSQAVTVNLTHTLFLMPHVHVGLKVMHGPL